MELHFLGFTFICLGLAIPALYLGARMVGIAWFRSKAEYDRGFRKTLNGEHDG